MAHWAAGINIVAAVWRFDVRTTGHRGLSRREKKEAKGKAYDLRQDSGSELLWVPLIEAFFVHHGIH